MIAALLVAAALLIGTAWFVVGAGRGYVDAELRVDLLLRPDPVLAGLSSTTDAAQRTDAGETTMRARERIAEAGAARAAAQHELEIVERAVALLGVLATGMYCWVYAALVRTMRERRQFAARAQAELHHDPLTGLPNRRFFSEWLGYAIAHARRAKAHVGVLFIDISGCATVAELHGGPAVEALLVDVARRFRAASREGDVFARLGAAEFALATSNAHDTRELSMLAQRLRDVLNDPVQPPLADTPIGTSIGIALFPEDAGDSAGVIAAANAAMYAARRAGRNHVAFNALAA